MSSSIVASFLGALEASLSVLLTISYGAIAARFNHLKSSSARDINKLCVRLFLPGLMIANLGDEVTRQKQLWALFYTLSSMALGWALKRMLNSLHGSIPAICFNNTNGTSPSAPCRRFIFRRYEACQVILSRRRCGGNSLTFAVGPRLLDDEETPDSYEDQESQKRQKDGNATNENEDEHENPTNASGRTAEEQEEHATETTTFLPDRVADHGAKLRGVLSDTFEEYWSRFPAVLRRFLHFFSSFFNVPLIGAVIGVIVGLVPPFRKAFFSEPQDGGIFKAWLTSSVKKTGAKLSASLLKMKEGKDSGKMKLVPVLTVFFIRFILWPIIGTFVLMLMPTGPSATKHVSGGSEEDKHAIAKFITLSYAVSPLICFTVVGSLKASLAAKS
ncbi:hypothetical protein BKA61DRAFT_637971 [Leptodontidium sp. MPI-SDFR-AT-0119]|nr:hypothetical protein BKA61DRAFT_637971 [Leptodontidium sp. MPI-SDFR-AT-0119]